MGQARYRIGIDVGGTFTDFVLADMADQTLRYFKEPSVPDDPSAAVERGTLSLMETYGFGGDEVELVVHGTTLGLNAIIQRNGAAMAIVVSKGNRDILEIARLRLPSSYDFTAAREVPLVPRDLIMEVGARMRSDGSVLDAVDADEVAAIAATLKARNVEAVAVMLLNSYRDPSLEIEVAELLREALPGVLVSESGVVWPEVREYERCLVAGLNAYIHPLISRYFERLTGRLRDRGIAAPIYITANNGGTLSIDSAGRRPIDTVLSGPASGVVASTRLGKAAEQDQLITFDMGGTSADIAVCQAGAPEFTTTTFVGDFPLMMPVVNVSAIGAGGGSVLWVDAQGLLKVGPRSAGAAPGPVCYGRGGTEATVTDCYLALGIIDPDRFLGGRMQLDREAALRALDEIADGLGMTGDDRAIAAAEAALRVASAKMATEIIKLLAQAGVDPRDYALVAYGGAGPTHANLLAEEASLTSVLVPMAPGTFCALGAVLADVRRDYVRTARHLVGGPEVRQSYRNGWDELTAVMAELEAEAVDWISREGDLVGDHYLAVSFNMRYPGQAYEIDVAIPTDERATLDAPRLSALFHEEHNRLYGFFEPATPIETTTVRLGVVGRVAPVNLPEAGAAEPREQSTRQVRHGGRTIEAQVCDRSELGAGASIEGPAIVEQPDTTTFILPGWRAVADRVGTLHLSRVRGQ